MNAKDLKTHDPKRFEREYWKWVPHAADYDWWVSAEDYAKEDGKAKGFDIDRVSFSGFGSQGDGAAWSGAVDLAAFADAHNLLDDPMWFTLIELVKDGWTDSHMKIAVFSERSRLMQAQYSADLLDGGVVGSGVFAGANPLDLLDAFGGEEALDTMEQSVLRAAQDYADYIYRMLQEEYESLTDEQAFIEDCDANGIEFNEEGEE